MGVKPAVVVKWWLTTETRRAPETRESAHEVRTTCPAVQRRMAPVLYRSVVTLLTSARQRRRCRTRREQVDVQRSDVQVREAAARTRRRSSGTAVDAAWLLVDELKDTDTVQAGSYSCWPPGAEWNQDPAVAGGEQRHSNWRPSTCARVPIRRRRSQLDLHFVAPISRSTTVRERSRRPGTRHRSLTTTFVREPRCAVGQPVFAKQSLGVTSIASYAPLDARRRARCHCPHELNGRRHEGPTVLAFLHAPWQRC